MRYKVEKLRISLDRGTINQLDALKGEDETLSAYVRKILFNHLSCPERLKETENEQRSTHQL